MSLLTRGGSLGIYFKADDDEPVLQGAPADDERVNMITGTKPPPSDPMTPGIPPKAQVPQVMDYTGLTLGLAALVGAYFLLRK